MMSDYFPLAWFLGKSVPMETLPHQPAHEPASSCCDGAWTTTRTMRAHDKIAFFHRHRERIQSTLDFLGCSPNRCVLPEESELLTWVRSLGNDDVILRINAATDGCVWVVARKLILDTRPVRLRFAERPMDCQLDRCGRKVFHQHWRTNLLPNDGGFDGETLLWSPDQKVLETIRSNVFLKFSDGWATPPADGSILPGIARQILIEQLSIVERTISLDELKNDAEAGFVVNSVRGVRPIAPSTEWNVKWEAMGEIRIFHDLLFSESIYPIKNTHITQSI